MNRTSVVQLRGAYRLSCHFRDFLSEQCLFPLSTGWRPDPAALLVWLESHPQPLSHSVIVEEVGQIYHEWGNPKKTQRVQDKVDIMLEAFKASFRYVNAPRLSDDHRRTILTLGIVSMQE